MNKQSSFLKNGQDILSLKDGERRSGEMGLYLKGLKVGSVKTEISRKGQFCQSRGEIATSSSYSLIYKVQDKFVTFAFCDQNFLPLGYEIARSESGFTGTTRQTYDYENGQVLFIEKGIKSDNVYSKIKKTEPTGVTLGLPMFLNILQLYPFKTLKNQRFVFSHEGKIFKFSIGSSQGNVFEAELTGPKLKQALQIHTYKTGCMKKVVAATPLGNVEFISKQMNSCI